MARKTKEAEREYRRRYRMRCPVYVQDDRLKAVDRMRRLRGWFDGN